jgi:exopolyphosphatase/guanosine-5'-triphosphate,3'-diphosphate pyrophosphatase
MKLRAPGGARLDQKRAETSDASDGPIDAKGHKQARNKDMARRTLEKLGHSVSNRPVATVPVQGRADKTTALRTSHPPHPRVGTWAAIDLGNASAKLLIMRTASDGSSKVLLDMKIGTALGKDVAPGEDIPPENRQRALAALRTFLDEAERVGSVKAGDIPLIATAVVRNAPHGAAFLGEIKALGLTRARTLSGDEEAAMGFAGALAMLKGAPGRYATLDLGGGSFQLAVGTENGMTDGGSTQLGSNVILDEMLTPRATAAGVGKPEHLDDVDSALATKAPMPLDVTELRGRTLVAIGGVAKFLRAHLGKDVITRDDIDAVRRQVIVLSFDARVPIVVGTKDDATKIALGIDTPEGARDYGKKLPASASLLLHVLKTIGVKDVRVSATDARHALIQSRIGEPE